MLTPNFNSVLKVSTKEELINNLKIWKRNLNKETIEYLESLLELEISGLNPKDNPGLIIEGLLKFSPAQMKSIMLYNLYNRYLDYCKQCESEYDLKISKGKMQEKNKIEGRIKQNFSMYGRDKYNSYFSVLDFNYDDDFFVRINTDLTTMSKLNNLCNLSQENIEMEYGRTIKTCDCNIYREDIRKCDYDYWKEIQTIVSDYVLKDCGINPEQYREKQVQITTGYANVKKDVVSCAKAYKKYQRRKSQKK